MVDGSREESRELIVSAALERATRIGLERAGPHGRGHHPRPKPPNLAISPSTMMPTSTGISIEAISMLMLPCPAQDPMGILP